ncbi:MAG: citrate synthase [Capsulimonadaceae bacterium]
MPEKPYFNADEATSELGVSRATLYAYVSRGLIRSEPEDARRRTRRYYAEDVLRLKMRQEHRSDPAKAVRDSLSWGIPIIDSAITKIADGRLYYRGHDAVKLADTRTVEEVAALIWTGGFHGAAEIFSGHPVALPDRFWTIRAHLEGIGDYDKAQALLPVAADNDTSAFDLRPAAVARSGRRILIALIAAMTGRTPVPATSGTKDLSGMAETLAAAWNPVGDRASAIIGSALILCADHELSASSFIARCVASAGSSPYAAVEGGLAALRGFKHGGISERVGSFLAECEQASDLKSFIIGRLQRGEGVPGFGHHLYPDGDPRVKKLMQMLGEAYPSSARLALSAEIIEHAWETLQDYPNIDYGLVLLSHVLELPPGSALCLLALGRAIGWIGHAIEEYQTDRLIRPRARYVGE